MNVNPNFNILLLLADKVNKYPSKKIKIEKVHGLKPSANPKIIPTKNKG